MKRIIAVLLIVTMLVGCGDPRYIHTPQNNSGKVYPTYGLLNQNSDKSELVCYELSVGNVIWSIILVETIVMPIYFVGFSLFNPVSAKKDGNCGIDVQ